MIGEMRVIADFAFFVSKMVGNKLFTLFLFFLNDVRVLFERFSFKLLDEGTLKEN